MTNEIKILVRTQNSAKAGFESVGKEIDNFARDSSDKFSKTFTDNLTQNLTQNLTTRLRTVGDQVQSSATRAGDTIGDTIGKRVGEKIKVQIDETIKQNERLRDSRGRFISANGSSSSSSSDRDREHVSVDVDVNKQSLMQKISAMGTDIKDKVSGFFSSGVLSGFTSVFSGDVLSTVIKGGLITLGAVTIAPALGAAVSAGILTALSGGGIALGIAAAVKDPRVKTAFEGIKQQASDMFSSFGANFTGPLENFLFPGNGGGGGLSGVLTQIGPQLDGLGKTLGTVADKLGDGVVGFLQNALPSILRGMEAGTPLINTLAKHMPEIGDAIADFFDIISENAPNANQFLNDFLNVLEFILPVLGHIIGGLTDMYSTARSIFVGLIGLILDFTGMTIKALDKAFGWIPGIGGKLHAAAQNFDSFAAGINKKLKSLDSDIYIDIHMRTFGLQTANAVIGITRNLRALGLIGKAAGGAVGQAASGGARSNMVWTGEQGPELLDLPPGTQVHTAGDSRRIAAQGDSGPMSMNVSVNKSAGANRELIDMLLHALRFEISQQFGGDVQAALGQG